MKRWCLVLGLCCAWIATARGQVTATVEFEQGQYISHEKLVATVRVTNFSGRTLHLGGSDQWLTFSVEGRSGLIVRRLGFPPVTGAFELPNASVATKRVNLEPYFDISSPDNYRVTASVQIPDLQETIQSDTSDFTIMTGTPIWSLEFGMPPSPERPDAPPEVRKYTLLQANRLSKLQLYFRLSNGSDMVVYKVVPVGRLLSFSNPEPRLDKESNLHLLYQDGPRTFKYFMFAPDGEMMVRQSYHYTTRPHLAVDEEGAVKVVGGARLLNSDDLPKAQLSSVLGDGNDH